MTGLDNPVSAKLAMNHPSKSFEFVRKYLEGIFAANMHAKWGMLLANGAVSVMTGASLAVSMIHQSLAQARGLLSNPGIVVWICSPPRGESCWRAQDDRLHHGLDGCRCGRSGDAGLEP